MFEPIARALGLFATQRTAWPPQPASCASDPGRAIDPGFSYGRQTADTVVEQIVAAGRYALARSDNARADVWSHQVPAAPASPTQRAIADYLDRETARIDASHRGEAANGRACWRSAGGRRSLCGKGCDVSCRLRRSWRPMARDVASDRPKSSSSEALRAEGQVRSGERP